MKNLRNHLAIAVITFEACIMPTMAGETFTWAAADGYWVDGANWWPPGPPTSADIAQFVVGGTANLAARPGDPSMPGEASQLIMGYGEVLGAPFKLGGRLNVGSGGTLGVDTITLGYRNFDFSLPSVFPNSTIVQSDGLVSANTILIGLGTASEPGFGQYDIFGGRLRVSANLDVGRSYGVGYFRQNGGLVDVGQLRIGGQYGGLSPEPGFGDYRLQSGLLYVEDTIRLGDISQSEARGNFTQTGSAVYAKVLSVENGTYAMSGGSVELEGGLGVGRQGAMVVEDGGQVVTADKLTVQGGSLSVQDGTLVIGATAGASPGSAVTVKRSSELVTAEVADGGRVSAGSAIVGKDAEGFLDVHSAGMVTVADELTLGSSARGTMHVRGGAQAEADGVLVGGSSDAYLLVGGTGSRLGAEEVVIGGGSTSRGVVDLFSGATLETSLALMTGFGGEGSLIVRPGAKVESTGFAYVGAGSKGTVSVEGGEWTHGPGAQPIRVGTLGGDGTLGITAGGKVQAEDLYIGDQGAGTLAIGSGGQALVSAGFGIGVEGGSSGQTTVSGSGSKIESAVTVVGVSGTGRLSIEKGAQAQSTWAFVGAQPGSEGSVSVRGDGSRWSGGRLELGGLYGAAGGTWNVEVAEGGEIDFKTIVVHSTLEIGPGGILKVDEVLGDLTNGGLLGVHTPGGLIEINGSHEQTAHGTLHLTLDYGGRGTGYEAMDVTGDVTLAGTLQMDLASGFTPTPREVFTLLFCQGDRSGDFQVYDLPPFWVHEWDPANHRIQAWWVPEPPGAGWALVFGSVALLAARCRARS